VVEVAHVLGLVGVFSVSVVVRNMHEVQALRTKLWRYGFVKHESCTYDVDEWNRPKVCQTVFTVLVKREQQQAFKAMLSQVDNYTESTITYSQT